MGRGGRFKEISLTSKFIRKDLNEESYILILKVLNFLLLNLVFIFTTAFFGWKIKFSWTIRKREKHRELSLMSENCKIN